MILELVKSPLSTIAPVIDLIQHTFKAEIIAIQPETWHGLLRHFGIDEGVDVPECVRLRQDMPPGQALLLPRTQFLVLDLVN